LLKLVVDSCSSLLRVLRTGTHFDKLGVIEADAI